MKNYSGKAEQMDKIEQKDTIDQMYKAEQMEYTDTKIEVNADINMSIIAVDPGREKTGVALLAIGDLRLIDKIIVPTEDVSGLCRRWLEEYSHITQIVCGNGTNHNKVSKALAEVGKAYGKSVVLTDEAHTTEEARHRYFEVNPPKGLKRLVPKGMLLPPEPVDDFTAWIIGERYLQKEQNKSK